METVMNPSNDASAEQDLLRLEVLRSYKMRFGRDPDFNISPFSTDAVTRYHTNVSDTDIPTIHRLVRERIETIIKEMHQGQVSQVVILTGNPGMGKTHLINCFRDLKKAEALRYVLVCNSNHWKSPEFEECLLDWILEALVYPCPEEPHLLLERIQDVAFQALQQIVDRPGEIDRYKSRSVSGILSRLWGKLTGSEHSRFVRAIEKRDLNIFRRIEFEPFAAHVCKHYLVNTSNLFHRYVMQVLLRYLFVEDREKSLHWLRRKHVGNFFLRKLGARDEIDRNFKVLEVIKILISLFTPDVSSRLKTAGKVCPDLVFFFAFDQAEAREALFENASEWRTFFAQLSELYNALPNVFILFTMTLALRNKYIATMEGQFRDRIRHDQHFILGDIEPAEVLSLYRQRVNFWLGDEREEVGTKLESLSNPYMPFDQSQVLNFAERCTLRDMIKRFDAEFRKALSEAIIDVPLDYQVFQKELRRIEEATGPFPYTNNHLDTVEELVRVAGLSMTRLVGLNLHSFERKETDVNALPVLRIQFCDHDDPSRWIRVFIVRLPFNYNDKIPECVDLLSNLQKARNFLWLVRVKPIDPSIESIKPGQVYARKAPAGVETDLQAVLSTLKQKDHYATEVWASGESYLLEKLRATYLGDILEHARQAISKLPSTPGVTAAVNAKVV
jgi:hypothetical protein